MDILAKLLMHPVLGRSLRLSDPAFLGNLARFERADLCTLALSDPGAWVLCTSDKIE